MTFFAEGDTSHALGNIAAFAMGLFLLRLALHRFEGYRRYLRQTRASQGRVVAIDLNDYLRSPQQRVFYTVTVEFFTHAGARRQLRLPHWSPRGIAHRHGQPVHLRYDPQRPETAHVRPRLPWAPAALALMGGLSATLFALTQALPG